MLEAIVTVENYTTLLSDKVKKEEILKKKTLDFFFSRIIALDWIQKKKKIILEREEF